MSKTSLPASEPDLFNTGPSYWKINAPWMAPLAVFALTVAMTVFAFPPFNAGELGYVFAVPMIFWALRRPRLKVFLPVMLGAQAAAWTILLAWLHNVSWLGLFLLGPFVGAWVGLWYLAVWRVAPLARGKPTPARVAIMLGLAGLWVLIEWTRMWFLSGFPWLPLAASQWTRPFLIQVASATGAGGVSFILACFNHGAAAFLYRLFFERELKGLKRRSPEFMAALLVLGASFLWVGDYMDFGGRRELVARIAVVEPNIPQSVKWDASKAEGILDALTKLTERASLTFPDLILWPEAAMPFALKDEKPEARQWIEILARNVKTPLLVGSDSVEMTPGGAQAWYNAAFVVDPDAGLRGHCYKKRHLVPFGEYVPFRPLLGWLSKITDVGEGDFHAGGISGPMICGTLRTEVFAAGPLICYEDIFPALARDNTRLGADLHVVLTNNGWFGQGGAAWQHAAHSILRAVETRRPVVRCSNGGWNGWIDEFGQVHDVMTGKDGSIYVRGTRTFEVRRSTSWKDRETFYVRHGDWFLWVCAGLLVLGLAAARFGHLLTPGARNDDDAG
ncbi:MAG: apolipoprotein N-acyltransferase [Opitutaceae bacterium]|jgi:apolipoprotein N-acyltransferase|nr:apolipoprotein N-acyltransferase [Opitutaceae bacterium]